MPSSNNQIKFPLGGNLFLTSAIWRGQSKIHIRKYIQVKDRIGKTVVVPTRYGVTLTVDQVNQLISALPLCLTGLAKLEETYTASNPAMNAVPTPATYNGGSSALQNPAMNTVPTPTTYNGGSSALQNPAVNVVPTPATYNGGSSQVHGVMPTPYVQHELSTNYEQFQME